MDVFEDYADLYDLFYSEKDYGAECNYIIELTGKYLESPVRSILDVGCGTGGHAFIWSQNGFDVTGLDLSSAMLTHARGKVKGLKPSISFHEGDVRNFDLGRKFDIVTAMFAVMSYQTATKDILSALHSVRKHLKKNGLFIFDAWSGPCVMSDPPRERVGYFEREEIEILRTVRTDHDISIHLVSVHYDILCIFGDRVVKRIQETHRMRYFFPQEVDDYASRTGFKVMSCEPFMGQGDDLRIKDWNATFILKAV